MIPASESGFVPLNPYPRNCEIPPRLLDKFQEINGTVVQFINAIKWPDEEIKYTAKVLLTYVSG
jgi:hypothetical protein